MGWIWIALVVVVIAIIIAKIKRSARLVIYRLQEEEDATKSAEEQRTAQATDFHQELRQAADIFSRRVKGMRSSNVEQMVSCEKCGVYVPASEAIVRRGKVYCCEEHSA